MIRGFDLVWEVREGVSEKLTFKQRWEGKLGVDQIIVWSKIVLTRGRMCVKVLREEKELAGTEKSRFTGDLRKGRGMGEKLQMPAGLGLTGHHRPQFLLEIQRYIHLIVGAPDSRDQVSIMPLPRTPWSFPRGKLNLLGAL